MSIAPEILYKEFEGTLSPQQDPSGDGTQADVYGYRVGLGVSFTAKLELFNQVRDDQETRPIVVSIRVPSRQGAGVVSEPLAVQEIRQAIDADEWRQINEAQDPTQAPSREFVDLKLAQFLLQGSNESLFAVTDEMQTLLLTVFDAQNWPATRDNMIEALTRYGSRAEQMDGIQATLDDLRAAEAWGQANGKPTLYE